MSDEIKIIILSTVHHQNFALYMTGGAGDVDHVYKSNK